MYKLLSICSVNFNLCQVQNVWKTINWNATLIRLLRDPRAGYEQSLNVLRHAKNVRPDMVTKSSIMLGVGETDDEILQTMKGIY